MRVFRSRIGACALAGGLLVAGIAVFVSNSAGAVGVGHSGPLFAKVVKTARPLTGTDSAPAVPSGYKVVKAGPFDSPGDTQAQAIVKCPGSEVPVGGGALISPAGSNNPVLFASINSSYPLNNEWVVDVNTSGSSGADANFVAYAVCIDSVSSYSVVNSGLISNPSGNSTLATATCPSKRVLVGGGGFSTSTSVDVNVGVDTPTSSTWRVIMNNGSAQNASVAAYAVCEKRPSGYSEPFTITTVLSGAETPLGANCPAGTVPLSGGDFTGGVMNLNLSSSFPSSSSWITFLNDGDSNSWPFETVLVCAS
jgi:hypothetical protein